MRTRRIALVVGLGVLVSACGEGSKAGGGGQVPATGEAFFELTSTWCAHSDRVLDTDVDVPVLTAAQAGAAVASPGRPPIRVEVDLQGVRADGRTWIPWERRDDALFEIEMEVEKLRTQRKFGGGDSDPIRWSLVASAKVPARDVMALVRALRRYELGAGELWFRSADARPIPTPLDEAVRLHDSLVGLEYPSVGLAEYLAPMRDKCPEVALVFADVAAVSPEQRCSTLMDGMRAKYDSCTDAELRSRLVAAIYWVTAGHRPERVTVPLALDAAIVSAEVPDGMTWGEWATTRILAPESASK